MSDCKGLFGKLFGHKFKKFLLSRYPVGELTLTNCYGDTLQKYLDYNTKFEYIIRCKRCGVKLDEVIQKHSNE